MIPLLNGGIYINSKTTTVIVNIATIRFHFTDHMLIFQLDMNIALPCCSIQHTIHFQHCKAIRIGFAFSLGYMDRLYGQVAMMKRRTELFRKYFFFIGVWMIKRTNADFELNG